MPWRDLLTLARVCEPYDVLTLAARYDLVGWLRWIISELPEFVRPVPLWDLLRMSGEEPTNMLRLRHLLPPAVGSRHIIGQALRLPIGNALSYLVAMSVPSRRFLQTKLPGSRFSYVKWWYMGARRLAFALTEGLPRLKGANTVER